MDIERRDLVIRQAKYFLSRKCYRYVKDVPSAYRRFLAYMHIYHKFGYQYSPASYFYRTTIKPRMKLRYVLKKIEQTWTETFKRNAGKVESGIDN